MSHARFFVFKLKDLTIPLLIFLIFVFLFIFLSFKYKGQQTAQANSTFEDGVYISNISVDNGSMDVIVTVEDNLIQEVSIDIIKPSTSSFFIDLSNDIEYIDKEVVSTQSFDPLPSTRAQLSAKHCLLMDAIKVALSGNKDSVYNYVYDLWDYQSEAVVDN